jgi:hypothetical protein
VDKFYPVRSLGEAAIEPLTTGEGVVLAREEGSTNRVPSHLHDDKIELISAKQFP